MTFKFQSSHNSSLFSKFPWLNIVSNFDYYVMFNTHLFAQDYKLNTQLGRHNCACSMNTIGEAV